MPSWNLFSTSDLFMVCLAFAGFVSVGIVLKTAFQVNGNK